MAKFIAVCGMALLLGMIVWREPAHTHHIISTPHGSGPNGCDTYQVVPD